LPLPLVGEAQPVIREPLAQASGMQDGEEGAAAQSQSAPEAPPVPVSVPVVSTVASAPVPAPAQPVVAPTAPVVAPVVKSAPVAAAAKPEVKSAAKPVSAPVVKPVARPAPAVVGGAPVPGGDWYAGRPAGNYALQILGTRSESSAKTFVGKHGGEYRYFKKLHQGQALYVVTYGQFSSRAAAQAAIKSLPAAVQAGKPWPRSFASIQQEAVRAR
jgi:DamX protein